MNGQHLLTVNTGSSSLKAALYRVGARETRLLAAQAERIGLPGSRLRLEDFRGDTLDERRHALPELAIAGFKVEVACLTLIPA